MKDQNNIDKLFRERLDEGDFQIQPRKEVWDNIVSSRKTRTSSSNSWRYLLLLLIPLTAALVGDGALNTNKYQWIWESSNSGNHLENGSSQYETAESLNEEKVKSIQSIEINKDHFKFGSANKENQQKSFKAIFTSSKFTDVSKSEKHKDNNTQLQSLANTSSKANNISEDNKSEDNEPIKRKNNIEQKQNTLQKKDQIENLDAFDLLKKQPYLLSDFDLMNNEPVLAEHKIEDNFISRPKTNELLAFFFAKGYDLDIYYAPEKISAKYYDFQDQSVKETVKRRENASDLKSAFNSGLRLTGYLNDHFYLQVGINYSQYIEEYNFSKDLSEVSDTIVSSMSGLVRTSYGPPIPITVYDTSFVINDYTLLTFEEYKIQRIGIPVSAGYRFQTGKFDFRAQAGVLFTVYENVKSNVFSSHSTIKSEAFINENKPFERTSHSYYLLFSGGVGYNITSSLSVFTEPYFRYQINNGLNQDEPVKRKDIYEGARFGLRYVLK